MEERLTMEKLSVEKMNVEMQEKIAIMNEAGNDKLVKGKVTSVRLPRLELKKFHGNILKWQEFWDTFESTILKNNNLQNADKFYYPRSQLRRQASKMSMSLELTNDKCNTAIALLKERYQEKQAMIDLHYAQINNILMAHLRAVQSSGESNTEADSEDGVGGPRPLFL